MGVVFPAKADLLVLEREQPMVGNRHPMRIAPQITKDCERAAEGSFGVDDPASQAQATQEPGKLLRITEYAGGSRTAECSPLSQPLQAGEEFASEDLSQNGDRQEEVCFRRHPAAMIR